MFQWLSSRSNPHKERPTLATERQLIELFSEADGRGAFYQLLADLEEHPQSTDFLTWFSAFIVGRVPPAVWANERATEFMLRADFSIDHFDAFRSLDVLEAACVHAPLLRDSCRLLEAALGICLRGLLSFSATLLSQPGVQGLVRSACRSCCTLNGKSVVLGSVWPVRTHPQGLLAALPPCYLARPFLLDAAAHVDDEGTSFARLPPELRGDKQLALAFLAHQTGEMLLHVPHELRADKEVVALAVEQSVHNFRWAAAELWDDADLLRIAAAQAGARFLETPVGCRHFANRDLAIVIAEHGPEVLLRVAEPLRADRAVVLAALTSEAAREPSSYQESARLLEKVWKVVATSLKTDRDFLQELLSSNGRMLALLDATHRADRALIRAAVRQHGEALQSSIVADWDEVAGKRRKLDVAPAELRLAAELVSSNRECWPYIPLVLQEALDLDDFECILCYRFGHRYYQCSKGSHAVCGHCAEELLRRSRAAGVHPSCPECRSVVPPVDALYGARNTFMERELARRLEALGRLASHDVSPDRLETILPSAAKRNRRRHRRVGRSEYLPFLARGNPSQSRSAWSSAWSSGDACCNA